jgi:hypothetical protein
MSYADIVFHIETTVNLDARTLKYMKVGYMGVNPVRPNGLYQDTTAPDSNGISIVFAETGNGGLATQDPILPPGFIDSSGMQSPPLGQVFDASATIVTSVNVSPYSAALSSGAPTAQPSRRSTLAASLLV